MISAFKHIRLSGYNLIPALDTNNNTLRLSLGGTGLAYYQELTGLSGYLQGLINTADDDVTRINNLSGAVTIQGSAGIGIGVDPLTNTITITGADSGYFQGLIDGLRNDLGTTGSNLEGQIGTVRTNLGLTGSNLEGQIDTVRTNLGTTGSNLEGQIGTVRTNLGLTGSNLEGQIDTVRTNLGITGNTLNLKTDALSGYVDATFVQKVNQQVFNTNVPQGVESLGVLFPAAFSTTPKVNVTLETAGDVMYMVGVRSRSTTGYYADFSDVVAEGTVVLNTFASNQ